jgi:hypothetical protein
MIYLAVAWDVRRTGTNYLQPKRITYGGAGEQD